MSNDQLNARVSLVSASPGGGQYGGYAHQAFGMSSGAHARLPPRMPYNPPGVQAAPLPVITQASSAASVYGGDDDGDGFSVVSGMSRLSHSTNANVNRRLLPNEVSKEQFTERMNLNINEYVDHIQEKLGGIQLRDEELKNSFEARKENSAKLLIHTNSLLDFEDSCFIPDNIGNVIARSFLVTTSSGRKPRMDPEYAPFDFCRNDRQSGGGLNVFGHKTKSYQHHAPRHYASMMGNISNCFISKITISHLRNYTSHAIGVTVVHTPPGSKNVPLGDARYYSVEKNKFYHYIIPPFDETKDRVVVYRSGPDINHDYAKLYPELTGDEKSLSQKVEPFGSGFKLVPVLHPIARYIFENAAYYPLWTLPQKIEDPNVHDCFKVPVGVYDHAVKELLNEVRNSIPVINLGTLQIQFEHIFEVNTKTHKKETLMSDSKDVAPDMEYDRSVVFMADMVYMFRDQAEPGESEKQ